MNTTTNNRTLKILTAILVLLLLGLSIYTIKFYTTVQDNELELVREKEMIELELRDMLGKYEAQQATTGVVRQQLASAQTRIGKLLDSLATSENTRDVLRNYRNEITQLRDERNVLLQQNDSLAVLARNLQNEKTAAKKAFDSTVVERDSLRLQNEVLKQELSTKTTFGLDSLSAEGIIVRRSGAYLVNDLAKRIDKIQVCYTLKGNPTDSSAYTIYTQIIDPLNNVIGMRGILTFGQKTLIYSARDQVQDDNQKRCLSINPREGKFEEGIYHINIFHDDELLDSILLQLN